MLGNGERKTGLIGAVVIGGTGWAGAAMGSARRTLSFGIRRLEIGGICDILFQMDTEFEWLKKYQVLSACGKKKIASGTWVFDEFFWTVNSCEHEGLVCPRLNLPTGVGYDLCKANHAESVLVSRLLNTGRKSNGIAWVFGHYYACEPCATALKNIGVKEIRVRESD